MLKINNSLDVLKISINKGKEIALKTEANETMRKIKNTINQTNITNVTISLSSVMVTANPARIPRVVATPLPPLNRKNIVQLCPHTHEMPKRIRKIDAELSQKFIK